MYHNGNAIVNGVFDNLSVCQFQFHILYFQRDWPSLNDQQHSINVRRSSEDVPSLGPLWPVSIYTTSVEDERLYGIATYCGSKADRVPRAARQTLARCAWCENRAFSDMQSAVPDCSATQEFPRIRSEL